jgi:hypothetical protein
MPMVPIQHFLIASVDPFIIATESRSGAMAQ